jgi:hypothetical protein
MSITFKLHDFENRKIIQFIVPIYVTHTSNRFELIPPVIDFGVSYSSSKVLHKVGLKVKAGNQKNIKIGYPFVPVNKNTVSGPKSDKRILD